MSKKRILIVGGVAGGASCAARARRLSEEAEIVIFDRGPYVSFANCGLPYYVGNVIQDEKKLLVATPELFKERFNIDIRLESEVLSIDRFGRSIEVEDLKTGFKYRELYDALVLAPGAAPVRPPLQGINLPGVFSLRTIPDSRNIRDWIHRRDAKRAVIVGGGFIGLEMTENLMNRGIAVTLIEMLPQVMPAMDPEMVAPVHDHLRDRGVALRLEDAVTGFTQNGDGTLLVGSRSGETHSADLVILGIGVRPETRLARDAGLGIGETGGIRVDDHMRTSDERIWAVGDAVEVRDFVTRESALIPLAGPANRQGRIAADAILGRDSTFRGVQATAVCGLFDLTIASTGASEKNLRRVGMDYEKIYLHPGHHVGYYPEAKSIAMKLLFSPVDGRILGGQAVGREGVEKRIDVIAMAIQKGSTVFDLEEAELCYAPQFGAAKDPVNVAGMVAANVLRRDAPVAHWEDIYRSDTMILDVRDVDEFEAGHIEGAYHIPLSELRSRMAELPHDREIWVYCGAGQRSYYATRALVLNGFRVRNLSGGFQTHEATARCDPDKNQGVLSSRT